MVDLFFFFVFFGVGLMGGLILWGVVVLGIYVDGGIIVMNWMMEKVEVF